MREVLNQQLEKLESYIVDMASHCEQSIKSLISSVEHSEVAYLENCNEHERFINQKERKAENLAIKIILEQQPVATDLRTVSSAIRIVSDFERIGDQIDDISKLLSFIDISQITQFPKLILMMTKCAEMISRTVDSFVKKDTDLARKIIQDDDEIDALFIQNRDYLIEKIKMTELVPELLPDILMIVKYLERIADHCNNICEWILYIVEGQLP